MPEYFRVLTAAIILLPALAAEAYGQHAERLLAADQGVEMRGSVTMANEGGGRCNVLETDTSYEETKHNDGALMDIWRVDYMVRNRSGRWLDRLAARFHVDSEWPDCTNWDDPVDGDWLLTNILWGGSFRNIQEVGRNSVAPDQVLIETEYFTVLRGDPAPRFSEWSMDFSFAIRPPTTDGPALPSAPPATTAAAELDGLFWQSIMNSTNPADFEAYLAQFPGGVFRALAENRLAELDAPAGKAPAAAPDRNPPLAAGSDARSQGQPFRPGGDEPDCAGQGLGATCWMELESHPGCYAWNHFLSEGETATWSAGCAGGLASGSGTLTWVWGGTGSEDTGLLRDGKHTGHWVERFVSGLVLEGPYVDGKRHGHWVQRNSYGDVEEGPYADGKQHGHWVERYADGSSSEGPYVDGKRHGRWVIRYSFGTTITETWVAGVPQ